MRTLLASLLLAVALTGCTAAPESDSDGSAAPTDGGRASRWDLTGAPCGARAALIDGDGGVHCIPDGGFQ